MVQSIKIVTQNGLWNWADFDIKQRELTCAWTADSSGNVSIKLAQAWALVQTYQSGVSKILGRIGKVTTLPTPGGTAPTAGHLITLLDDSGADVLQSATSSTAGVLASVQEWVFSPALIINSDLTLTVSGAGSGGQGTIIFHFVR